MVGMTLVQYWMEFKFKILLIYFWLGFDKINKIYSLVESNVAKLKNLIFKAFNFIIFLMYSISLK